MLGGIKRGGIVKKAIELDMSEAAQKNIKAKHKISLSSRAQCSAYHRWEKKTSCETSPFSSHVIALSSQITLGLTSSP